MVSRLFLISLIALGPAASLHAIPCSEVLANGLGVSVRFLARKPAAPPLRVVEAWLARNGVAPASASTDPSGEVPTISRAVVLDFDVNKTKPGANELSPAASFMLDLQDRMIAADRETRPGYGPKSLVLQQEDSLTVYMEKFVAGLPTDWNISGLVFQTVIGVWLPIVGVCVAGYELYRFYWKDQVAPSILRDMQSVVKGAALLPEQILALRIQNKKVDWTLVLLQSPPAEELNQPAPGFFKKLYRRIHRQPLVEPYSKQNALTLLSFQTPMKDGD